MLKIIWIIIAIIMGIFLGSIGSAIYEANYSDGLQLLPLDALLKQLVPGMIIGAITGGIFYKPVSILGLYVLSFIASGDLNADIDVTSIDFPDLSPDIEGSDAFDCGESNQSHKDGRT